MNARVESKVLGALVGLFSGTALSSFLVWLLGVTLWGADSAASGADDALKAVPWPVSGLALSILAALGTFVGGYYSPHTTDAERGIETGDGA